MKARLLKKFGGNYAGQVLTNVQKGDFPAGVAEFFEDDADPAVNTVVEQHGAEDPLMVVNDEINPEHAKAHNESERAKAKASREYSEKSGVVGALEQLEKEQTQERAKDANEFAAERVGASKKGGKSVLSKGQIEKNKAGKGHGRKGK